MVYMGVIEHACECRQCLNHVSMFLGAFWGLGYIVLGLNINNKHLVDDICIVIGDVCE
jgi:hypothetical protein